jgi:hypothetical protein
MRWYYSCTQFILLSIKRTSNNDFWFFCFVFCFLQTLFWKILFVLVKFTKYWKSENVSQGFSFLKICLAGFVTHNSFTVLASLKVIIFNSVHCTSFSVVMSSGMFWLRNNLVNKIILCFCLEFQTHLLTKDNGNNRQTHNTYLPIAQRFSCGSSLSTLCAENCLKCMLMIWLISVLFFVRAFIRKGITF